ncbi:peptidase T [Psychroflexus aestuariivivens]|uniref:peptidase T n=1 Tax=Psychroflexus aestuariivivens TaxID=1795040 RepID=UPI000FD919F3|nr:peptidase T [Psychroflexus aestuariivivens]
MIDKDQILARFIQYIKIDSQSDPNSETTPSTNKQWEIANILKSDLENIGLQNVEIDEHAYVMATLPSNIDKDVPNIGFVAHFDTSPDFKASDINPQIHHNYDGGDIILNKEKNIVLSSDYFEDLKQYKGQTIITTDGTTLLSADDKAGVTEIVTAMEYLVNHPEIKHGTIKICFTPDEEIGRGAHKFDVEEFDAKWAYTMDGSQIGELEYENFNAAKAKIEFNGTIVHPGYAKGKMVNAMYLAQEFASRLPVEEVPEKTSGYEGFFHLTNMKGKVEHAELNYIIRDHDLDKFEARKQLMKKIAHNMNQNYGKDIVELKIENQYFNMKEKVEPVKFIVDVAEEAMKSLNIQPILKPIRGGTDGAQLSYKGLPCPNIFAGGHNFHGKYEYLPLKSMIKATEVIIKIAELTPKRV